MSLPLFKEHDESFPIRSIANVVAIFRKELAKNEPDLLLLSLVVGAIECTMTSKQLFPHVDREQTRDTVIEFNPTVMHYSSDRLLLINVDLHNVEELYAKFYSIVKDSVDLSKFQSEYASQKLIETVSEVILSPLTNNYSKGKSHLQSIYSFLTGQ